MSISEEQVKNALKVVKYPGFSRDIVSFGLVKSVTIDNGDVKGCNWPWRRTTRTFPPQSSMMPTRRCSILAAQRQSFDRHPCAARRRRRRNGRDANSGHQTCDRHRQRQGRRRQIHRRREPRGRARANRRASASAIAISMDRASR